MEIVEIARAKSERGEVILRERRTDNGTTTLELRVNGTFVMDTAETGSERALATAALALVEHPESVLIGGLGLGFTLAAVLSDSRVSACTVVELEQTLVDWMREGTIPHGAKLLTDERVRVVVGDVALALDEGTDASFDLVLLDVDNGPAHLVHDTNRGLYLAPFLHTARRITRQVLAVWSAAESSELREAMCEVFGDCETISYDVALGSRAETYWLYVSRCS